MHWIALCDWFSRSAKLLQQPKQVTLAAMAIMRRVVKFCTVVASQLTRLAIVCLFLASLFFDTTISVEEAIALEDGFTVKEFHDLMTSTVRTLNAEVYQAVLVASTLRSFTTQ